jgi:hypothetical protein
MYYSHNLRSNLQEWKNRLYEINKNDFGYELRDFMQKIEKEKILINILEDTTINFKYDEEYLEKWMNAPQYEREKILSKEHQIAIHFQFWIYAIKKWDITKLINYVCFHVGSNGDIKSSVIEKYITPMVNYLHDKLDDSSSITYLLEKYKKRTEWFFSKELLRKYKNAENAQFEQVFDDDLRLFLFEQGIDYPFSTPKTPSGRADIIGQIDTNDPLIVEVKVFDLEKNYRKDRITSGFSQCVKYANDYNKNVAYLVVFNVSPKEIVFKFKETDNFFPPKLIVGNKVFYFVVINLNQDVSASKIGKTDFVEITEADLGV